MAPPHKRRKLFDFRLRHDREEERESVVAEVKPPFSHAVDSLDPSTSPLSQVSRMPHHVEEIHVRIEEHAVGGVEYFQALLPRQASAVSIGASVVISSGSDANSSSSSSSTSTTISDSTSLTTTLSPAESVLSGALLPTESSTASTSSDAAISAASAAVASVLNVSALAITPSITSGSSPSATAPSSLPFNLTASSASISPSSNTSLPTLQPSTNTTEPVVFLATLSGGDTATLNQSYFAYSTTLSDGEVFTVPAMSSSTSESFELSSTTLADGSTSVMTITASDSSSDNAQSSATSAALASAASGQGAVSGQEAGSTTVPSSATSTDVPTTNNDASGGSAPSAPPGTIAGGVVGGAAGLAVILLVAMLFLRWFRRRNQTRHQQLPVAGAMGSPDPDRSIASSRSPGMAERAGLMPLVGAVPALFRHQNRSQNRSIEDADDQGSSSIARSFTRVSGRKLPSQWSPGMASSDHLPPPPDMPLTADHQAQQQRRQEEGQQGQQQYQQRNPFDNRESLTFFSSATTSSGPHSDRDRGSSNYDRDHDLNVLHDDEHIDHIDHQPLPPDGAPLHETMTMVPGPRRQPTIHRAGPHALGTAHGTAAETGWDSNRGSRFTEEEGV